MPGAFRFRAIRKSLSGALRPRGVSSLKSLQYGLKIAEEKSGVKKILAGNQLIMLILLDAVLDAF